MTEQKLKEIEACADNSDYHSNLSEQQVKSLIAEVRWLRKVIKMAEWQGDFCDDPACPWCLSRAGTKHADVCVAFTTDGDVR